MALETATYISDLNAANPTATDPKSQGDDHIRLLKSTIKATFPNIIGSVATTNSDLNAISGAGSTGASINVVTQTLGDSSLKAASTQFVANQAFSTALPSQSGNSGKFVTTNGSVASWGDPFPVQTGNAGKTLVTNGTEPSWDYRNPVIQAIGNGSLSSSLGKIISVCDGGSYVLPDFTGVSGFSIISAANTAALPTQITTSDNWKIDTGFSAGTTKILSAISAATPHGTWGGSTIMTPPQLASSSILSSFGTPILFSTCQLSSGVYVGIFGDYTGTSYNLALAVIDTNTNTIGTPVALSTGSSNTQIYINAVFAVSATGFCCVYNDGSASSSVIAGTVSGTTITLGTSTNIAAIVETTAPLSASSYICSYQSNTGILTARAFTVSGTVVTLGTAATLDATAYNSMSPVIEPLTSTTAVVGYFQSGGGSNSTRNVAARVLSVSGTTITVNTQYQITSQAFNNNFTLMLTPFIAGSTYLFGGDNSASNGGTLHTLSISGTVITFGSALSLTNGIVYGTTSKTWDFATIKPINSGKNKSALRVSDTQILISGWGSSNIRLIERSGTTLTNPSYPSISGSNTYDLVYDPSNGTDILAVGSGSMAKLTLSGSVLTVGATLVSSINVYASQTMTDSAVNYSGTWYSWKLPTALAALSPTKWLLAPDNASITLNGPVS